MMMTMSRARSKSEAGPKGRGRQIADDEFRAQLREAGLKVTSGRLSVLRELSRQKTPISHAELAETALGEQIDKVTVWRILVALTEAGLVDRTDVGDHTWRFELRSASMGHTHPHFMCVSCKSVQCLPREAVRVAPRLGRGVIDVQIKGRCESCS